MIIIFSYDYYILLEKFILGILTFFNKKIIVKCTILLPCWKKEEDKNLIKLFILCALLKNSL